MQRERMPQLQKPRSRDVRASSAHTPAAPRAVAHEMRDDLDGQLGPDELPDADEVVMNREAKRHRG